MGTKDGGKDVLLMSMLREERGKSRMCPFDDRTGKGRGSEEGGEEERRLEMVVALVGDSTISK